MSEYDYQEVEPNKRFFEVLREFSDDKRDPLHEWEFLPNIHTIVKQRCICTTPIQNNFYIQHKRTKKQLIIGSECVKRWLQPTLECKECEAPLGRVCERVRKQDFICPACKRAAKKEAQEELKKLGNYKLLWAGKYYYQPFKIIAEDIPYVEYLLNLQLKSKPKTLQVFEEYISRIYEVANTPVAEN